MLSATSIGSQLPDTLNECCDLLKLPALAIYLRPAENSSTDLGAAADHLIYTNEGQESVTSLLPDSWTTRADCQICLFSPLHFRDEDMGYCVIPYNDELLFFEKHRKFSDNLSLALSLIRQQERLHQMNLQLQQLYIQDQLTGLYNRFGYEDQAKAYFQQQKGRVYVIFLDVDNLKVINDQYGHTMGDLAIKGVAEAMKTVLSQAPIKARMGGDEFLAIGPYTDEESLLSLEQQIRQWLVEYSANHQISFTLTASMGHVWSENMVNSLEHLVQEADHKMYAYKKARKRR